MFVAKEVECGGRTKGLLCHIVSHKAGVVRQDCSKDFNVSCLSKGVQCPRFIEDS